ncbi:MAG: hypothetical protein JWR09_5007 [Mucilaginibacter sp.]|nr:hypothetical protein [Mucilaginibacter sp.]
MQENKIIFTIEARDNVYLESMAGHLKLDNDDIYNAIEYMHAGLLKELKKVNIDYFELKNALTPQKQKREIAFVFDSEKTGSTIYGAKILNKIIPLLDKQTCNSVLVGDLIGDSKYSTIIRKAFFEFIEQEKDISYISHDLFFIVYLNNLSDLAFQSIREGLKNYAPYVGYFDLTFSSVFKHFLSSILVRGFVKNKNQIIAPDEETGKYNPTMFNFEKYGFQCNAIESLYYDIFLSYKIERPISLSEEDIRFSLNAVSTTVLTLSDFKLVIEEPKLQYLMTEKKDNFERAGLANMSIDELQDQIKSKLNTNYIFNLCFLPEYGTIKFNIMLETIHQASNKPMKLIVALEYVAKDKILRLITMF